MAPKVDEVTTADAADLLWKQYQMHVDLYKFYLEFVLKANTLFYAITGGIVAYYFKNATLPLMKWSLLLPISMSLVVSGLFFGGAVLLKPVRYEIFRLRDELGFQVAPEVAVLQWSLRAFGVLLIGVAASLGYIIFR